MGAHDDQIDISGFRGVHDLVGGQPLHQHAFATNANLRSAGEEAA
jgi:hypothetical protein